MCKFVCMDTEPWDFYNFTTPIPKCSLCYIYFLTSKGQPPCKGHNGWSFVRKFHCIGPMCTVKPRLAVSVMSKQLVLQVYY